MCGRSPLRTSPDGGQDYRGSTLRPPLQTPGPIRGAVPGYQRSIARARVAREASAHDEASPLRGPLGLRDLVRLQHPWGVHHGRASRRVRRARRRRARVRPPDPPRPGGRDDGERTRGDPRRRLTVRCTTHEERPPGTGPAGVSVSPGRIRWARSYLISWTASAAPAKPGVLVVGPVKNG